MKKLCRSCKDMVKVINNQCQYCGEWLGEIDKEPMNKTTLENWEDRFDDEFTYFDEDGGQYILSGYDEKTRLNTDCIPEIKNFIKDLLASSQKDKEKAVEELFSWFRGFLTTKEQFAELNKKLESLKAKKE